MIPSYLLSACDSKDWDERVPRKSDQLNHPNDGTPWKKMQDRLLAMKPLSEEEIKSADKVSAYKLADR